MPRPYARLRETTFDLYLERDLLPGYYKVISILSSWLVLAGYILFAIAFTTQDDDLRTTRSLVTATGSGLLILGYVGILTVALLSRSLLFIIDGVVLPILTASFVGLFVTVANYGLHTTPPVSQIYLSIPLVTACVTTVVSAIVLGVVHRELQKIRSRDERRRWHLQLASGDGSHPDSHALAIIPAPEEEAQRRQLMRLLRDRGESVSTPNENNTFKIDLPGEVKHEPTRDSSADHERRSAKGLGLVNLLPWKNNKDVTFKDARERRREEIERSSMQDLEERLRAVQDLNQYPPSSPPLWGWPPATRYA